MNSKLLEYLEEHCIEVHDNDGVIMVILHFLQIADFVKACTNDECTYDFDDDEAYPMFLRGDYVCIEINDIIEHLEEDIEDYKKLCTY